ncbi:MAG: flagellar biosynthetic protein FliQ [Polyangiaceae bacterium]|nr:flagellar biosynthetic protein FliQ [Polyangiaceae bacterium]
MNTTSAIDLLRHTFITTAVIVGPMMLAALLVGLIVGVLQAATQINEASIAFVSKMVAVVIVFALFGSWILQQLVDFTIRTFASIAYVIS